MYPAWSIVSKASNFIKTMSKKNSKQRTLRERPVAGYAVLPDICSSSLRLHVRCLAYPATGRLQFLGMIQSKS